MWFEELTGFKEENPQQVRNNIRITGNKLISKVNQKVYAYGELEVPTLEVLRNRLNTDKISKSKIQVSEVIGDVQQLHQQKENNGALFQVASQFNLLEMTGPDVIPEEGVGIYERDNTQGPACAIACGAGTIFRNYFVDIDGQKGQTATRQINCLDEISRYFNNKKQHYWRMSNGYALFTKEGLHAINHQIENWSRQEYEMLKGKLRIGIQWDTEVTINQNKNIVTQAYCSALPVAYSLFESELLERFARLILEATYEATLLAAIENFQRTGNNKVFLTLVGGGVFGNKTEWIIDAVENAVRKFITIPLDIKMVSYNRSNYWIKQFINRITPN
ncbi:hypothetical protein LA303_09025 [Candidatus Sulfidibacterium hydrothermale]|uniref:hypothetical protein n=1 Tax=Candidatus Sulfidibacterium hydrothermale TaxID=2875962 RepID=UPI001F0A8BC2|nr:hypothetical protein [Candidatus Sulfidibacterium hydrothermale]UBM61556.1 hypothetical protein LA303_09025 [Candidatus Sulfidibacterium hydrothermale]